VRIIAVKHDETVLVYYMVLTQHISADTKGVIIRLIKHKIKLFMQISLCYFISSIYTINYTIITIKNNIRL